MADLARRALLVGVDHYVNFSDLQGCVADVGRLHPLVARHEDGEPNFDCKRGADLTRDQLLRAVDQLLAPGADLALLYFAGHGKGSGDDVALCTKDGTSTTPGLAMAEVLGLVARSSVSEVLIVLDCCFAGAAGSVPQIGGNGAVLRPGLSILAASRGDQTSAENADGGLFTRYLAAALDGGAADVLGKVTIAGLYAHVTELFGSWNQRPTFKTNVDRLHELRTCAPALPKDQLRRLPALFPEPDGELALDPSYEPTAEPRHPEHEEEFSLLQRCRAARLVEPVGHEHMYDAAMASASCRLTPLGRHYRTMAAMGRL